jgi:hypothetical protein
MEGVVFGGENGLLLGIYTKDLNYQNTSIRLGKDTYLFTDVKCEMLRVLFSVPSHIIQI